MVEFVAVCVLQKAVVEAIETLYRPSTVVQSFPVLGAFVQIMLGVPILRVAFCVSFRCFSISPVLGANHCRHCSEWCNLWRDVFCGRPWWKQLRHYIDFLFCEGLSSQLSQGILGLVGDRCGEGLADFALDARHAFDATKTVHDSGTTKGRICTAYFACCLEFPVRRPQISQAPIQLSIHILVLELGGPGKGAAGFKAPGPGASALSATFFMPRFSSASLRFGS